MHDVTKHLVAEAQKGAAFIFEFVDQALLCGILICAGLIEAVHSGAVNHGQISMSICAHRLVVSGSAFPDSDGFSGTLLGGMFD